MTTPDSEPFTITAIKLFSRRYGEDCDTRFEIWDSDRSTLYSDIVSHSEYSAAVDSFDSATWGYKDVPNVVVSGDFYIAMYTDSSDPSDEIYPDTGVYVGYDTSFSSDRSYTTQGKTLTWDLSSPQATTNWMIRVVGTADDGDTTPPTLAITSPAPNTTTHIPTITIAGTASDASGIASVTVNDEPANGTLNWSANVTLLEGENTIPVVATDGEGLTTTAAVTVRYEPLCGDLNSDGTLTSADAAIALCLAAGGSASCDATTLAAADVSGDNRVTSLDALMILQAATAARDV